MYIYIFLTLLCVLASVYGYTNRHRIRIIVSIGLVMLRLPFVIFYQKILNRIYNSKLERQDRNIFLTYYYKNKQYKIKVGEDSKINRNNVLAVQNEKGEDVGPEVNVFYGPLQNWHGEKFSPGSLGFDCLTFYLSDGSDKTFKKQEIITL